MLEITFSTEDTIRKMEYHVTNLKIILLGENVSIVCSRLRSAITVFSFLDKLPQDLTLKLLSVFQTSSIIFLNDIFNWFSYHVSL